MIAASASITTASHHHHPVSHPRPPGITRHSAAKVTRPQPAVTLRPTPSVHEEPHLPQVRVRPAGAQAEFTISATPPHPNNPLRKGTPSHAKFTKRRAVRAARRRSSMHLNTEDRKVGCAERVLPGSPCMSDVRIIDPLAEDPAPGGARQAAAGGGEFPIPDVCGLPGQRGDRARPHARVDRRGAEHPRRARRRGWASHRARPTRRLWRFTGGDPHTHSRRTRPAAGCRGA